MLYTAIAPGGDTVYAEDDSTIATGYSWSFTTVNNPHGALDTTFGANGVVTNSIEAIHAFAIQPDGAILAAGSIVVGSVRALAVARFLDNGALDTSFGGGDGIAAYSGMSDASGYAIALQSDGKILVAGRGVATDGFYGMLVTRFTAAGELDTGFGNGGLFATHVQNNSGSEAAEEARGVMTQSDGKIYVVASTYQGVMFARLLANGTLDGTFGTNGITIGSGMDYQWAGLIQADDKPVAVGQSGDQTVLRRVNLDGSHDSTFGNNGRADSPLRAGFAGALQADGKILTGSNPSQFARFLTTGALDSTFNNVGYTGNLFGVARAVGVQQDGYIIAAGEIVGTNGSIDFAISRLTPSGAVDTTFGVNGRATYGIGTNNDFLKAVAVQGNGRILVGGYSAGSGTVVSVLARYLP